MRTSKSKDGIKTFHYTIKGNDSNYVAYLKEVNNCDKVVSDTGRYLDWYKWNFERAKKEYESRVEKIQNHKDFKELILENLKKMTLSREDVISRFEGREIIFVFDRGAYSQFSKIEEVLEYLDSTINLCTFGFIIEYKLKTEVDERSVTVVTNLKSDFTFDERVGVIKFLKGDEDIESE